MHQSIEYMLSQQKNRYKNRMIMLWDRLNLMQDELIQVEMSIKDMNISNIDQYDMR